MTRRSPLGRACAIAAIAAIAELGCGQGASSVVEGVDGGTPAASPPGHVPSTSASTSAALAVPAVPAVPAARAARAARSADFDAPMPRPARGRLAAAIARDAECASCHPEQAAEWRTSRHHEATTNEAFREAFAIEPAAFCRRCHAPEAAPDHAPPADVAALGVGCVTCHLLDDGSVLAAPARGTNGAREAEDARALAAHRLRRSVDFAREGACAGCHEFRFPSAGSGSGSSSEDDGVYMQTTIREHARARSSETPCASCHMPRASAQDPQHAGGARRSHSFAQVRDPAWLRARLTIRAELVGDGGVRITLTPRAPGHAFPTGDLFRRLEIVAERSGRDGGLHRDARHLARHFVILPDQPSRSLVRDDRIFDAPVTVDLALPPGGAITWWVRFQRVATVGVGDDPAAARIESELELAKGTLP